MMGLIIRLLSLIFRVSKRKVFIKGNCSFSLPFAIKCSKEGRITIKDGVKSRANLFINVSDKGYLEIRDNVFFNRGCSINCRSSITIQENCIFGENVLLYDHDHFFDSTNGLNDGYACSSIVVGKGCWIGAGTILLRGATIGDNCLIAAGSVVKRDVPSNSLYYNKRESIIVKEFSNKN